MLISNSLSINNKKYNNKQTNPLKFNQLNFKGLNKDVVELHNDIEKDNNLPQEEKTYNNLLKFGLSPQASNDFINKIKNLNFVNTNETLEYLTKDVPDIENKELQKSFIENRYRVSSENINPDEKISPTSLKTINKEKFDFFTNTFNKYPKIQNSKGIETLSNVLLLYDEENLDEIDEFIDKDENAQVLLQALVDRDFTEDKQSFDGLKNLLNKGCSKDFLSFLFKSVSELDEENEEYSNKNYNVFKHADTLGKQIDNLKKSNIEPQFVLPMILEDLKTEDMKTISDFMKNAVEHRTELGSQDLPADDVEMASLFILDGNTEKTLKTFRILGKDNLIKMFPLGIDGIDDIVQNVGQEDIVESEVEPLKELINPTGSLRYQNAQNNIDNLKRGFNNIKDNTERDERIKKIANENSIKKEILKNSLKDTQEKDNAIRIYLGLIDNDGKNHDDYKIANEFIPYLKNINNDGNKLNEKLKEVFWKNYEVSATKKTIEKMNFKPNNYIQKLAFPSDEFENAFSVFIDDLNKSPDKTIKQTLDKLPQNENLKETMNDYGLDYDVWTGANPDLKVNVKIEHNFDKMSKNAIGNLEAEFNDDLFKSLPDKQQDNIKKCLKKGGYDLKKEENIIYEGDGYFAGTNTKLKLYKDNEPVQFNDLSKIYKLLNSEFTTNSYWNIDDNESVQTAKGTFKNHIATRHEEMKRIRQYKGSDSSNITIQKVDMDNVSHSLFLGNDSSCCTAIGSFNDWTAPNYIRNKMVQAIELKDGDESIGNTMMYLIATSPDKMGLLLDNIELKPKYQYNEKIENGIIEFANKFAKRVANPNIEMDIYAGPNRHKLDMNNFELSKEFFQIIGSTFGEKVYLDFITSAVPVDFDAFEGGVLKLKNN